jgi:sugar lactone lactonase YvrE
MFCNRRCGVSSIFVATILTILALATAPSLAQISKVQSSTRYAGTGTSGYNNDFGSATTVSLDTPSYIVFDSNGNQFISDTLNNCVRKIDPAGNVTTVAGLAVSGQSDTCNNASNPTPTTAQGLYQPTGLAIDSTNRLYIADSMHNCVRSLASNTTGVANLTTVAGTCGSVPTASATPAPNGIAIDSTGNLYISLQDSVSATPVYQVVQHMPGALAQSVCYLAGATSANVTTPCPGITNGIALVKPSGLAIDVNDDLFIADTGNNCVREVVGLIHQTTAIGQCLNDGTGTSATAIQSPYGIAISPNQTVFLSASNNILSYSAGSITIVGGLPSGIAGPYDSTQDGKSALSSSLYNPRGLAIDANSHLFVADSSNNIARELSSNLDFPTTPVGSPSAIQPITFAINQPVNLSVVAGTDYSITSTTCSGPLSPATSGASPNTCQVFLRFTPTRPGQRKSPLKLTDAISGTSFFSSLQGIGTGALGLFTPGAPAAIAASLSAPSSIAVDSTGNAYVLETSGANSDIRMIPAAGGSSQVIVTLPSGQITPTAITSDAAGNWFVADSTHGTIARFGADNSVKLNYVTGLDTPVAVLVDGSDNLFIAQAGGSHNVIEIYGSGIRRVVAGSGTSITVTNGVPANTVTFASPAALAMDLNGTLYIADQAAHQVYAIDTTNTIHIVAGNGTTTTTSPGQATGTAIIAPSSLFIDAAGDIYIADQSTGIIYAVYTSTSNGTNIAAVLNTSTPPAANGPLSVALDGSSNLFIARTATNSVLELSYPNPTLDFGTLTAGNTSPVQLQSFVNVGTDNLNINTPFSTSDTHFAVDTNTTTCGTSVLSGSICNLGFTFTPSANATYTATSTINSNSFNTPQPITLTGIGKQLSTITVSLAPETAVYGQPFSEAVSFGNITTAPTGTITFTTGGQTLCTLSGTLSAINTCNAPSSSLAPGTHTVTFNYSGDTNYNSAAGVIALAITPATLTFALPPETEIYAQPFPETVNVSNIGAVAPTGLISYTIGKTLLCNANITLTTVTTCNAANSGLPVGTYTVTFTYYGDTNYAPYGGTTTLTVTQAPLTVTANSATRAYGAANPTFSGSTSGLLNGDTVSVTYSTTANTASPVGSYPITPSVSGASNYNVTIVNGTLTITANAAALIINVNSAARRYGQTNPSFSGTVAGVIPGDDVVVTYNTTATPTSAAGNYPIGASVSGTSATNYIATIHPGTLAISPASTVTTLTTSATPAVGGTSVTFTASVAASSGTAAGTVNFYDGSTLLGTGTLNASAIATFSTSTLTVGAHTISAAFQANTDFTASTGTLTQAITQPSGSFTISANPPAPFIRGAGATTYQVTVASVGAFNGPVALTCSGLAADATCSFSSPTVTLTAGGTATSTMTVTTTAADARLQQPNPTPVNPATFAPITAAAVFPVELTGLGVLFSGFRRRKLLGTQKMRLLLMIAFSLGILGLMGCGCPNTTFKTYTINVTGTSLTFPAPAQTTSVVLSVGQ